MAIYDYSIVRKEIRDGYKKAILKGINDAQKDVLSEKIKLKLSEKNITIDDNELRNIVNDQIQNSLRGINPKFEVMNIDLSDILSLDKDSLKSKINYLLNNVEELTVSTAKETLGSLAIALNQGFNIEDFFSNTLDKKTIAKIIGDFENTANINLNQLTSAIQNELETSDGIITKTILNISSYYDKMMTTSIKKEMDLLKSYLNSIDSSSISEKFIEDLYDNIYAGISKASDAISSINEQLGINIDFSGLNKSGNDLKDFLDLWIQFISLNPKSNMKAFWIDLQSQIDNGNIELKSFIDNFNGMSVNDAPTELIKDFFDFFESNNQDMKILGEEGISEYMQGFMSKINEVGNMAQKIAEPVTNTQISEYESLVADLRKQIEEIQQEVEKLKRDLEEEKKLSEEYRLDARAWEENAFSKWDELIKAQRELEQIKNELESITERSKEMEEQLSYSVERIRELKEELKYADSSGEYSGSYDDGYDAGISSMRDQVARLEEEINILNERLGSESAELERVNSSYDSLMQNWVESINTIESLKDHINDLNEKLSVLRSNSGNDGGFISSSSLDKISNNIERIAQVLGVVDEEVDSDNFKPMLTIFTEIEELLSSISDMGHDDGLFEKMRQTLGTIKTYTEQIRTNLKEVNVNFAIVQPEGESLDSDNTVERQVELLNRYKKAAMSLIGSINSAVSNFAGNTLIEGGSNFMDVSQKSYTEQTAYYKKILEEANKILEDNKATTLAMLELDRQRATSQEEIKNIEIQIAKVKKDNAKWYNTVDEGKQLQQALAGGRRSLSMSQNKDKSALANDMLSNLIPKADLETDFSGVIAALNGIKDCLLEIVNVAKTVDSTSTVESELASLDNLKQTLQKVVEQLELKTQGFKDELKTVETVIPRETELIGKLVSSLTRISTELNNIIELVAKVDMSKLVVPEVKTPTSTPKKRQTTPKVDKNESLKNEFLDVYNKVKEVALYNPTTNGIKWIGTPSAEQIETIDKMYELVEKLKTANVDVSKLIGVGNDAGKGFVQGIDESKDEVHDVGKELAEEGKRGFQEGQHSSSPSKDYNQFAHDAVDGFKQGGEESQSEVYEAGKELATYAKKGFEDGLNIDESKISSDKFQNTNIELSSLIELLKQIGNILDGDIDESLALVTTRIKNGFSEDREEVLKLLESLKILDSNGNIISKIFDGGRNSIGANLVDSFVVISRKADSFLNLTQEQYDLLISKENEAANAGINLAKILSSIKVNNVIYEIQELANGESIRESSGNYKNLVDFIESSEKIVSSSDDKLLKLFNDAIKLNELGFELDLAPGNIIDDGKYFKFIDLSLREIGKEAESTEDIIKNLSKTLIGINIVDTTGLSESAKEMMDCFNEMRKLDLTNEQDVERLKSMEKVSKRISSLLEESYGYEINFIGGENQLLKLNKNGVLTQFKDVEDVLSQYGKNAVQGFINGAEAQTDEERACFEKLANIPIETIKNALDIHSPSRVMEQLGVYTAQGFKLGADKTMDDVRAAILADIKEMTEQGENGIEEWRKYISEHSGDFSGDFSGELDNILMSSWTEANKNISDLLRMGLIDFKSAMDYFSDYILKGGDVSKFNWQELIDLKNIQRPIEEATKPISQVTEEHKEATEVVKQHKKEVDELVNAYEWLAKNEGEFQRIGFKQSNGEKLSDSEITKYNKILNERQKYLDIINKAQEDSIKLTEEQIKAQEKYNNSIEVAEASVKQMQKQREDLINKQNKDVQLNRIDKASTKLNKLNGKKGNNTDSFIAEFDAEYERIGKEIATMIQRINANQIDLANPKDIKEINKLISSVDELEAKQKDTANISGNAKKLLNTLGTVNKLLSSDLEIPRRLADPLKEVQVELQAMADSGKYTKQEVNEIVERFMKLNAEVDKLGGKKNIFRQMAQRLGDMNAKFIAQYLSFQDLIRYARSAFETIHELDTALIDLKKTTTMTSSELDEFYYSSNNIAKSMGVTTEEIINQAAAWSRLGYSSKDAAETMAELSSKFASVSPGMSTDEAQTGLVSIMKAWGIGTDQVEREVMDNINTLGNKFAETNSDIVTGMEKSAATFAALGQSWNDAFALFTGAQEVMQNAETVGK